MAFTTYSPAQQIVLTRISAGDTLQTAAEAAGVHRNTVGNWRRTSPAFRSAWDSIHYEQAMHWREQALPLAPLAMATIRQILEDPNTSPAVRLRAALAVHKIVSTPPPAQREAPGTYGSANSVNAEQHCAAEEPGIIALDPASDEAADDTAQPETVHNPAQSISVIDDPNNPGRHAVVIDPRHLTAAGMAAAFQKLIEAKRALLDKQDEERQRRAA